MEDSLLPIGSVARLSGLPVSALRFYDGAGVLVPAAVDPRTGYRRYAPEQVATARLVARLRRVGLPLADVRALLGGATPGPVLDAHLERLEDGLAAARRELSAVRALLDLPELTMQFTVPTAALDAVRYAVGTDPSYTALHGVLLDAADGTLHVVASDRHRIAVVTAPASAAGRLFLPVGFVDQLRALGGTVTVTAEGGTLTAGTVRAAAVPDEFPDWRRLEPAAAPHKVALDGPAFRAAVSADPGTPKDRDGVPYEAVVLTLGPSGELTVGASDGLQVGVNRDFLLDALADHDQLVLELDGPITPLAIRLPDRADWSLLMPVDLAAG